ncbi:hypothetical protein AFLA70_19g004092 [Aspergillus flavus AF70]|nr:hypothetical protein AFLA70_19g004092 [Aspergillus flavus AF70]
MQLYSPVPRLGGSLPSAPGKVRRGLCHWHSLVISPRGRNPGPTTTFRASASSTMG